MRASPWICVVSTVQPHQVQPWGAALSVGIEAGACSTSRTRKACEVRVAGPICLTTREPRVPVSSRGASWAPVVV